MGTKFDRPLVVVDWDDAFIETDDFTKKEGKATKPVRRFTAGWFITETDKGVVLATDYYKKKADGFAARMFIPHGMINNVYEIEE